ncbi:MAG: wrbA [Gemmatimonadetes bacterium]|jgi:NAD(P)H dehydrogenase (quinone)|nr:wrbA [Gemmatimonadota bacterium]
MSTRVLVVFYSLHGHVEALARAVGAGAESVRNTAVRIRRFPDPDARPVRSALDEATLDDLRWADGIAWGTPTRYGAMATPMKRFLDGMIDVWKSGELEDKPAGVFTSTASIHGGQESTILTTLVPLLHFGMIFVGTPYVQNPQIMTADAIGGSPYGPSTVAGPDGSRPVADVELVTARNLGVRLARVASATKIIRVTSIRGQDIVSSEYGT